MNEVLPATIIVYNKNSECIARVPYFRVPLNEIHAQLTELKECVPDAHHVAFIVNLEGEPTHENTMGLDVYELGQRRNVEVSHPTTTNSRARRRNKEASRTTLF